VTYQTAECDRLRTHLETRMHIPRDALAVNEAATGTENPLASGACAGLLHIRL